MKSVFRKLYCGWLRKNFAHFGHNSYFSPIGVYLYPDRISVGDYVYVGPFYMISAVEGITIGNDVIIGPEFMVMGGDHNFRYPGIRIRQSTSGINRPITIEDDVWIGARCLLLKGVTIGEGAVVGAGSIVTKNVPAYSIYAGNPAKKVGDRFSDSQLRCHLEAVGSKYSVSDFQK